MANYTFTPSVCYTLKTHDVEFTATNLIIKLSSTGQQVLDMAYGKGLAVMCQKNDLCVGVLSDNGVFKNSVNFESPKASLKLDEKTDANVFIGSNDEGDSEIYKYNINQCPVRLSEKGKVVTIECPCESDKGTCTHKCYTLIKA
jgi:hypothetical protein